MVNAVRLPPVQSCNKVYFCCATHQTSIDTAYTTPIAPTPPREEEIDDEDDKKTATLATERDRLKEVKNVGVEFSDKLRAACFLLNKGRKDTLSWKVDDTQYCLDVPEGTA
jgi:hypothetical protein